MYRGAKFLRLFGNHICLKSFTRNPRIAVLSATTESRFARNVASRSESKSAKASLQSLIDRDLFLETAFARSAKAKIRTVALADGGKTVEITWDDGQVSRYHSLWLRHNCHCPSCRLSTNQTVVNILDMDLQTTVTSAEKEGDHLLRVTWSDDTSHTGLFPLPFLKHYTYSGTALEEKSREMDMVFTDNQSVPEVPYDDVMNTDAGLYRWLKNLGDYGICFVKNVPSNHLEVKRVAERMSALQPTIYGETFDVIDKPRPSNFAYTPLKLGLHMDQLMYESAPGVQLLHCMRFDEAVTGGSNVFVDLFHVAETLREQDPQAFKDLARIPVTWETVNYGREMTVHMVYQRPHISLNHNGQIVGLSWHPSLVGPLQVKEEDVEPYYRAFKKMATLVDNFPSKYRFRLQEGDLISFNNRRVLHGRDEFNPNTGHRHLQGCYVQIDEFKSQLQIYANKIGDGKPAPRVGNRDWQ